MYDIPNYKNNIKISHFIVFLNYLLLSAKRIVSLYFMFQLYTMTTIPSGSIANYYCPLNHNSPIATPECKELGNSYCLDKPPFLVFSFQKFYRTGIIYLQLRQTITCPFGFYYSESHFIILSFRLKGYHLTSLRQHISVHYAVLWKTIRYFRQKPAVIPERYRLVCDKFA